MTTVVCELCQQPFAHRVAANPSTLTRLFWRIKDRVFAMGPVTRIERSSALFHRTLPTADENPLAPVAVEALTRTQVTDRKAGVVKVRQVRPNAKQSPFRLLRSALGRGRRGGEEERGSAPACMTERTTTSPPRDRPRRKAKKTPHPELRWSVCSVLCSAYLPETTPCSLNTRVGANSPSLCPTMFSVTKT